MARPKKNKDGAYSVSITFGAEKISGKGETMVEAIKDIPVPVKIFVKGTIRATDGTRKVERTWMPVVMKRLFFPNAQYLFAKRLEHLMK